MKGKICILYKLNYTGLELLLALQLVNLWMFFWPQFSVFFFFWRSATQRRVVETYMLIKGKPCSIAISPLLAVCAIASVKFPTFLG